MFRTWLIYSGFIFGILLFLLGIYYHKSDPDSWVRSSTGGIEFPEWFTFIYTEAVFITMATIVFLFT